MVRLAGSRMRTVGGGEVGYIFEWDPVKAETNVRKHAVTFDEASTVFGDPLNLSMADPSHFRATGHSARTEAI